VILAPRGVHPIALSHPPAGTAHVPATPRTPNPNPPPSPHFAPQARALYIFPTKALAQDQLRALRALTRGGAGPLFGLRVETFDGDTLADERSERRDEARVLLTNPDMLHASILPQHKQWREVLFNLRCAGGNDQRR
jgi:hypothetical protein